MKLLFFVVSAVFFLNPNITAIDFLPDCAAYFMMMRILYGFLHIYDSAHDAYSAVKNAFLVSVVRFAFLPLLPYVDGTMNLVLSFSFGLLEIWFGSMAFLKFYDTAFYIADRCNCDSVHEKSFGIKKFTVIFIVIKEVFAIIPDLTLLSDYSNEILSQSRIPLSHFRPMLILVFGFAALAVGIVWAVKFIKFGKNFLSKELKEQISCSINEAVISKKAFFDAEKFSYFIILILVASVFSLNFNFENVNIIPDGIFSIVVIIAFAYAVRNNIIRLKKKEITVLCLALANTVISFLNTSFSIRFFSQYSPKAILRISKAEDMYAPIKIFSTVEALIFVAEIVFLLIVIKDYALSSMKESKELFVGSGGIDYIGEGNRIFNKKIIVTMFFAVMSSVSYIVYTFALPYNDSLFVMDFFVGIIFIVSFFSSVLYMYDEVFMKIKKYL